jgi:hypothetical protein
VRKFFKSLGSVFALNAVLSIFNHDSHEIVSEKGKKVLRSGEYCKCGSCGHEGYAYGIAHATGVSAPFCHDCGVNSKLTVIK